MGTTLVFLQVLLFGQSPPDPGDALVLRVSMVARINYDLYYLNRGLNSLSEIASTSPKHREESLQIMKEYEALKRTLKAHRRQLISEIVHELVERYSRKKR